MRGSVILLLVALAAGRETSTAQANSDVTSLGAAEEEPTHEACLAAVGKARLLADRLPAQDASRAFAASYLRRALMEDANGEYDDCIEWADKAVEEVVLHWHILRPGEQLDGLGPAH